MYMYIEYIMIKIISKAAFDNRNSIVYAALDIISNFGGDLFMVVR